MGQARRRQDCARDLISSTRWAVIAFSTSHWRKRRLDDAESVPQGRRAGTWQDGGVNTDMAHPKRVRLLPHRPPVRPPLRRPVLPQGSRSRLPERVQQLCRACPGALSREGCRHGHASCRFCEARGCRADRDFRSPGGAGRCGWGCSPTGLQGLPRGPPHTKGATRPKEPRGSIQPQLEAPLALFSLSLSFFKL